MKNEEKLEAVIKQAQDRGWMEGWKYSHSQPNTDELKGMEMFAFLNINRNIYHILSLNDILFGTDFCEKFIGDFIMGDCSCGISCVYDKTIAHLHRIQMATISEPERIDFLYKHVENNPTLNGKLEDGKTTINDLDVDEVSEKIGQYAITLDKTCDNGHHWKMQCTCKTQPVEVKEIEKLELNEARTSLSEAVHRINDLCDAYNNLIAQVNANTKDIAENKRDCKINRN